MGSSIDLTATSSRPISPGQATRGDARKGLVVIQENFGVNHHTRNDTALGERRS